MRQSTTRQPDDAGRVQETDAVGVGRGGRMSRQRKTAAVLRLLRGEDLETVSRSLGDLIEAARLRYCFAVLDHALDMQLQRFCGHAPGFLQPAANSDQPGKSGKSMP